MFRHVRVLIDTSTWFAGEIDCVSMIINIGE